MTRVALSRGTFLARPFARKGKDDDDPSAEKPSRFAASYDGFDVHCAVRIAANDDEGCERLLRYCAPAVRDRPHRGAEGRARGVPHEDRAARQHPPRDDAHRERMARIAALIPP
jgi:hypothetical protein